MAAQRSRPAAATDGESSRTTSAPRGRGVDLGPLQDFVGYHLRRAQQTIRSTFASTLAEVDLTPARFGLLNVIERNPGLSQADACEALGIQPTNLTPLLYDLEERDLIARRTSPTNRRTKMLELTPAGKQCLERALRLHEALEEKIVRCVGGEGHERLLDLLARIAAMDPRPGG
jgi:DNA-binding MarR family transcriptional regulator